MEMPFNAARSDTEFVISVHPSGSSESIAYKGYRLSFQQWLWIMSRLSSWDTLRKNTIGVYDGNHMPLRIKRFLYLRTYGRHV